MRYSCSAGGYHRTQYDIIHFWITRPRRGYKSVYHPFRHGTDSIEKSTSYEVLFLGGQGWIRTTEVTDGRFTVCSLWPLGNLPIFSFADGGAGGRTRTPDLLITNQLLYQLSYTSMSLNARILYHNFSVPSSLFFIFFIFCFSFFPGDLIIARGCDMIGLMNGLPFKFQERRQPL